MSSAALEGIRERMRHGTYTPDDLRQELARQNLVLGGGGMRGRPADVFVDKLLFGSASGDVVRPADKNSYWYVPTDVSDVLRVVDRVPMDKNSVVYDIGSGLGIPAMLIGFLSGAKVHGVEYEKPYVDLATSSAQRVGLPNVEFHHSDARGVDYSKGDVFFMYAPFVGNLLDEVLEKLRTVAESKPITIAWHGPSVEQLKAKPWLRMRRRTMDDGAMYFFQSNPALATQAVEAHIAR